MHAKHTRLRAATIAVALILVEAPAAHATTLGSADMAYPPSMLPAQLLGATTGRIVIDPRKPLGPTYDAAVQLRREAGLQPQFVVGGAGTTADRPQDLDRSARAAVQVAKRYPDAYSISVYNEPDLIGVNVCRYARAFARAYRQLKRIGVQRVLLGEIMANHTTDWLRAWRACGQPAGDGFAWHGYDLVPTLPGAMPHWGNVVRLARSYGMPAYLTEFGVPTRGPYAKTEQEAVGIWKDALGRARALGVRQIVAYHVNEDTGGRWDTSLVDKRGRLRPAFMAVAAWAETT